MRPLLLASDLDGTLLGPNGEISANTIGELRRVSNLGVVCVAATGRSHVSARDKLAPAGVFRWLIASNGAGLYDLFDDSADDHGLIEAEFLEPDEVAPVVERINATLPGCGYAWETSAGMFYDQAYREIRSSADNRPHERFGTLAPFEPGSERLAKFMVVHLDAQGKVLADHLRNAVGPTVNLQSSGLAFMEITSLRADKALMLATLCERLGVTQAKTVAFGDQLNDLGMLKWAAGSYLMASGDLSMAPQVSALAPSNAEDGVASVLRTLWPVAP